MAKVSVKLTGGEVVLARLKKLSELGDSPALGNGIEAAAQTFENSIRSEAPEGPTGDLKDSVESGVFKKRTGKPFAGFARVNADKLDPRNKGLWNEFGTTKMTANRFFSRGARAAKSSASAKLDSGVKAAIAERAS